MYKYLISYVFQKESEEDPIGHGIKVFDCEYPLKSINSLEYCYTELKQTLGIYHMVFTSIQLLQSKPKRKKYDKRIARKPFGRYYN